MLALLYVVSTLYAGRSQGRLAKNLANGIGLRHFCAGGHICFRKPL